MIISTGMNTLESCAKTYEHVKKQIGENIIMLHTTNLYPTPFIWLGLGD